MNVLELQKIRKEMRVYFLQKRKIWLLLIGVACLLQVSHAQSYTDDDYPTVGRKMPSIQLNNIVGLPMKSASIDQFLGKWLILDFWNKGCASCVQSFPITNQIQRKYADRVQILLVGLEDRENQIRPMFRKFTQQLKLDLPCVFDSALFKRLDIFSCPHVVIIDSSGIVRAVTSSLSAASMDALMAGKNASWSKTYFRMHDTTVRKEDIKVDSRKLLFVNNNGGPDSAFIFRSLIGKWQPGMPYVLGVNMADAVRKGLFQVTGCPLYKLYNFVYYGKYYWSPQDPEYGQVFPYPILNVRDTSIFIPDKTTGANFFCYSLYFPAGRISIAEVRDFMRFELNMFFRLSSKLETRNMPYWALVSIDSAKSIKLLAKGDSSYFKSLPHASFAAKNWPIKNLINTFSSNIPTSLPFINESGISGNIDIALDCILTDVDDVKRSLKEYGLDVIQKARNMKVIVFNDL